MEYHKQVTTRPERMYLSASKIDLMHKCRLIFTQTKYIQCINTCYYLLTSSFSNLIEFATTLSPADTHNCGSAFALELATTQYLWYG